MPMDEEVILEVLELLADEDDVTVAVERSRFVEMSGKVYGMVMGAAVGAAAGILCGPLALPLIGIGAIGGIVGGATVPKVKVSSSSRELSVAEAIQTMSSAERRKIASALKEELRDIDACDARHLFSTIISDSALHQRVIRVMQNQMFNILKPGA